MAESWLLVAVVLTATCLPGPAEAVKWTVSPDGATGTDCIRTRSCQSLVYVLSLADDYDVIEVDGRTSEPYTVCYGDSGFMAALHGKFLSIVGVHGTPKLSCAEPVQSNYTMESAGADSSVDECLFEFQNVAFENMTIFVDNCTVRLSDTTFHDANVFATETCDALNVTIFNSTWYGRQTCDEDGDCENQRINNLTCSHILLTVHESSFYQTLLVVVGLASTRAYIRDSFFSNLETEVRFLGGLHLTFSADSANILVANCRFENLIHPTRVQSVVNLYEAAIWLKALVTNEDMEQSYANAIVTNCTFVNNERGIIMVGPFNRTVVQFCTFVANMAMHAGAAMLVIMHKQSLLRVTDCTFRDNVAGRYRDDYPLIEKPDAFVVKGSEVDINAKCCKGAITLVGKGGAIRVQRGVVQITGSTFINNTARLLGGSVFVDIDGIVQITETNFESTPVHQHALQGDVLYSDGEMRVFDVVFKVQSAQNGLSILRHSGDHWSIDITNVWIECPVGYDLRATNASAYGVTPDGLRRSYKLDQLSYFCESCPRNKYSMDHGFLNYTMQFNDFAYFTLLINGSVPSPQYSGNYLHHVIKCDDCPYGGHCVEGITAVANFWGYQHNRSVKFQHCPKGYCCSTPECPSIDSCVENRRGRLCGRCEPGYSEALFSPTCIPNEQCGPIWLYPFALSVGLVYALFLLFQTDLKDFLFTGPLCCENIAKCTKQRKTFKAPYMNGVNGQLRHDTKLQDEAEDTFIPNNCNSSTEDTGKESQQDGNTSADSSDTSTDLKLAGSGFLIILFYYFQDALLLNVKTVYVTADNKTQELMKSILSSLFKFQLDLFELIEEVCAVPDMTAVPKVMTKALIVPYIIFIFFVMYLLHRWCRLMRGSPRSTSSEGGEFLHLSSTRKTFATRLSSGFILTLMFMFQKMGTTTFQLLNCVPVEGDRVLYIDGTITCYENWQYGVLAYATLCVTPFFLVLLLGPKLLERGTISLAQFFIASLCPLPMLVFWCLKELKHRKGMCPQRTLNDDARAVIMILQGPFKENRFGLCWSGILIGRRLVLILLFTFVNDSLIRLLCMLLTCFVILLHHVHVQPYKDFRGNIAGTTSAAALVTLGSINLVRAGFEAAEYTPTGPNAFLMKIFNEIENFLLLWLPLFIMSCVVSLLIFRITSAMRRCICKCRHSRDGLTYHLPASNT